MRKLGSCELVIWGGRFAMLGIVMIMITAFLKILMIEVIGFIIGILGCGVVAYGIVKDFLEWKNYAHSNERMQEGYLTSKEDKINFGT